jgi:type I restriction enzyme S subunit
MRNNWEKTNLINVISEKISGEWGTPPQDNNFIGVIRTTNFTNRGIIDFSEVVKRNIDRSKINRKQLKVGDSVIEKSGGSPSQPVGRVVFFERRDGQTYLCNNFTTILRPSNVVLPKFLFYFLFQNHLAGRTQNYQNKTTGIINLQLERYLNEEKIPLPPLSEQNRIVSILDRANELIEKRKKAIGLLDEYLKSVFLDMFGDPVTNPKGWEKNKLSELGKLDRGVSKHRPRNAPVLLGGEHPLIQTGEVARADLFIKNYTHTYSEIGLKQSKKWPAGTLCITIAANIARTGILQFDACFPDSIVGFVPNETKTTNIFIHYWVSFLQKILEDSAPESAQKNINLQILRNLDVITPSLKSQKIFSEEVIKSYLLKNNMRKQLVQFENKLHLLMKKYF